MSLGQVTVRVIRFFPVSIISKLLHTHLHVHFDLCRKDKRANPGKLNPFIVTCRSCNSVSQFSNTAICAAVNISFVVFCVGCHCGSLKCVTSEEGEEACVNGGQPMTFPSRNNRHKQAITQQTKVPVRHKYRMSPMLEYIRMNGNVAAK